MSDDSYEWNVYLPNRERCDDWVSMEEALEQAEAFMGLGTEKLVIERRGRYRGDSDLGGFLAWASTAAAPTEDP